MVDVPIFDVISMHDFSKEQIIAILDAAEEIKRAIHSSQEKVAFEKKYHHPIHRLLEQVLVGTPFTENSTRTYHSSRTAVLRAGGQVDGFPSDVLTSLKKGETLADTSDNLSSRSWYIPVTSKFFLSLAIYLIGSSSEKYKNTSLKPLYSIFFCFLIL